MIVAYAATRSIYHKLIPSIKSLKEHNNATVYILAEDDEIPIECDRVINVANQTVFNQKNTQTHFTYMSLMRLLLPDLITEDRVIYLDVDTIICDTLEPLWNIDMEGKYWAAVNETYGRWKPLGPYYFNAGVSVFNLKEMRKDNITQRCIELLNMVQYPFPDQDVMNIICVPDKVIPLHPRFNENFATGYTHHPAIVHYAGYPDWYENRSVFRHEYLEKYL